MPKFFLEDIIKQYPRVLPEPESFYPGEGAVNPAYQVVEDSCLLQPNKKKIWVLRGDMILAVGIKNANMSAYIGATE